jgi:hypothetical protein
MIKYTRLPKDIKKRLERLREYIKQYPQILFAYLFGGLTRENISPLSDVDIALYVKEPDRVDYLSLYTEISNQLGTDELDLVILNKASLSLAGRILMSREVLFDRDPFFRHNYESLTLRKFFDFQFREKEFLKRKYKID